jgi:hypothetical protein
MRDDLSALAEADVDDRFTADVLARTAERRWKTTLRAVWESWSRRPRIAWELSYVATLLVFSILGVTGRSVAELPLAVAEIVSFDLERPLDRIGAGVRQGVVASLDTAENAVWVPSRDRATHVVGAIESTCGKATANVGTFVRRLASLGAEDDDSRARPEA